MAFRRMPYRCMARLGNSNILIAARGSSIDSLDSSDGSILSTWTCPSPQPVRNGKQAASEIKPDASLQKSESASIDLGGNAEHPAKKRRLSNDFFEKNPENGDEKAVKEPKKKQSNRLAAVSSGLEAPAVAILIVTREGKHVIAVTEEDKCIRVFETVMEENKPVLKQLSQRAMPKRPCAVTLSADNTTIISADKFGDVYSLPLIPSAIPPSPANLSTEPPAELKPYVPAANEFTIHSERNRKALENQRRQINPKPEKLEPTFEHKLLLGHVSMLTDVTLASIGVRNYILTADRDEHIRVSRGIPQTHIIEGFCLGHTEFISRLCIPSISSTPLNLLISGGGDDDLFLWDWLTGHLISKCPIVPHIDEISKQELGVVRPAISSIQHTFHASSNTRFIIVTSESVPAIFAFILTLTPEVMLRHAQTIQLPGNALSVVLAPRAEDGILVSIDTIFKTGAPKEQIEKYGRREERTRREDGDVVDPLLSFVYEEGKFVVGKSYAGVADSDGSLEKSSVGSLSNLLYGLENLRKREGDGLED